MRHLLRETRSGRTGFSKKPKETAQPQMLAISINRSLWKCRRIAGGGGESPAAILP